MVKKFSEYSKKIKKKKKILPPWKAIKFINEIKRYFLPVILEATPSPNLIPTINKAPLDPPLGILRRKLENNADFN